MKITVCIIDDENKIALFNLLTSLEKQSSQEFDIIIISSEEDSCMISDLKYQYIHTINKNDRKKYQQVVEQVNTKYCILLKSEMILEKHFIKEQLDLMEKYTASHIININCSEFEEIDSYLRLHNKEIHKNFNIEDFLTEFEKMEFDIIGNCFIKDDLHLILKASQNFCLEQPFQDKYLLLQVYLSTHNSLVLNYQKEEYYRLIDFSSKEKPTPYLIIEYLNEAKNLLLQDPVASYSYPFLYLHYSYLISPTTPVFILKELLKELSTFFLILNEILARYFGYFKENLVFCIKNFIKKPRRILNFSIIFAFFMIKDVLKIFNSNRIQKMSKYKKSDTLVIFGSGSSTSAFSNEEWEKLNKFDTMSLNSFIVHPLKTTYIVLENNYYNPMNILYHDIIKYKNFRKPIIFYFTFLKRYSVLKNISFVKYKKNRNMSSLKKAISIAKKFKYKKVILAGFDGTQTYFSSNINKTNLTEKEVSFILQWENLFLELKKKDFFPITEDIHWVSNPDSQKIFMSTLNTEIYSNLKLLKGIKIYNYKSLSIKDFPDYRL